MRTTAASYRWGRDKRWTSDRERQRERKKRVGEMERNEKRGGKRENKVLVGEKGKRVGGLAVGESNQARILV